MDTPEESPKILSLCTGYGGIELGLERVFGEITTVAHVEIEAYAIANLVSKMEQGKLAPSAIWTNLKTLPLEVFRRVVDIITGGYPCQPFSIAGKGHAENDPRHLWPFFRNTIDFIRPRFCFLENVEGHITRGLYDVLEDLGGMGYRTTWGIFSAAGIGLSTAVKEWPTPTARDFKNVGTKESYQKRIQEHAQPLPEFVINGQEWPTPLVADADKHTINSTFRRGNPTLVKKIHDSQPDQVHNNTAGKNPGQLNPDWVEQLMSVPKGWTDSDC